MSTTFSLSIPERYWQDISLAPKDGAIVFIRNDKDEVDIARWSVSTNEWNSEFGCMGENPTHFAILSIF